MALACGMSAGRPIYFAVDFDAAPGQQTAINAYFDGAASVLGYGRTGAYGGYYPVQRLFDAGKITWGWQTYAWSGGQWESRTQLRQVQNGITVDGADCDQDQAWAADYGQWGARAAARQSQVVAIGGQGGTQSQVAAIGLDGAVYHDIRAANGVLAGWEPLDGADGASRFSATAVSLTGMSDGTHSSSRSAWTTVCITTSGTPAGSGRAGRRWAATTAPACSSAREVVALYEAWRVRSRGRTRHSGVRSVITASRSPPSPGSAPVPSPRCRCARSPR
ncbi:hypothetical protein ABIA35_003326 [Catenulispora sp. MAP12-49]